LSRRIGLLEGEVAEQTRKSKAPHEVGMTPEVADERFKQLLSAMETFWAQAPKQTPLLPETPPPLQAAPVQAAPTPEKKPKHRWMVGVAMAAAAVGLSFVLPQLQSEMSHYMKGEARPVIQPKPFAVPAPPLETAREPKQEQPLPPPKPKAAKPPQRFEGPQIALEIPANVRAKVPAEARVQVVVAIDEQGNVVNAEVESMAGTGARLLTKQALAEALRSRFRPAREGERPIESQMVLTYLFKPESTEF